MNGDLGSFAFGTGPASCKAITSWVSRVGMSDDHLGVVSADAPCML